MYIHTWTSVYDIPQPSERGEKERLQGGEEEDLRWQMEHWTSREEGKKPRQRSKRTQHGKGVESNSQGHQMSMSETSRLTRPRALA